MSDCSSLIVGIYQSPQINNLIGKLEPSDLRDDLRQELALALLDKDCDRLQIINRQDKLLGFSLRIVWNMATSKTSPFYAMYRKKEFAEATEYLLSLMPRPAFSGDDAAPAVRKLYSKELGDIHEAHEARIFNKYVELDSCAEVARHFKIPPTHVQNIVRKMKAELKQLIKEKK